MPEQTPKESNASYREVTIPVMFGDGRTRKINYEQIKNIHSPTLLVTEVLTVKKRLLKQVQDMVATDQPISWDKVNDTLDVLTQLALEAAEAIARFGGNRWQSEQEVEVLSDERLSLIMHHKIATGLGTNYYAVIKILMEYLEELEQKGDSRSQSLKENILRIENLFGLAQKRTDPIVHVYPKLNDPGGYLREISFIEHENNLSLFKLWDAPELSQRNYDFFFQFEGDEIPSEPWKYLINRYFSGLPNLAETIKPEVMKKWRQGKITSHSDLTVEEYRDKEKGRWFERSERKAGTVMVVRMNFDFDHGNTANTEMFEDLITLIPKELLENPGDTVW